MVESTAPIGAKESLASALGATTISLPGWWSGSMASDGGRRGGREARRQLRAAPLEDALRPVRAGLEGGRYRPLSPTDITTIHTAALVVLERLGMAQALP